jgi:hypothetical protein
MSMEVAPPPYTPSDILKVLTTLAGKTAFVTTAFFANLVPSDGAAVQQDDRNFEHTLPDDADFRKMEKDTQGLCQDVLAIQTDFIKIRDVLQQFDAKHHKDKNGNSLALESQWIPFQEACMLRILPLCSC